MTDPGNIFRVLVLSDYSLASRQALEAAAEFDWRMPVEMFVLTVEEPLQTGAQPVVTERELSEESPGSRTYVSSEYYSGCR